MKFIKLFAAITLAATSLHVSAQIGDVAPTDTIAPTTYTYATKGGEELKLDVIAKPHVKGEKRPVLIYSFGGAWETGSRKDGKFLQAAAKHGWVGVNIDYRLMMKKLKAEGAKMDSTTIGTTYGLAIDTGVEDLYDATSWLVNHSDELGIDPTKIMISGGSAGATNSFMAEYYLCNDDPLALKHLPKGFRYAGVMTFAGGIWKHGVEDPQWKHRPCPIFMFHGDKDQLVTYESGKIPSSDFSAYGPGFISKQFDELGFPYMLLTDINADHVMAGGPDLRPILNYNYMDLVYAFAQRFVFDKEQIQINTIERPYDGDRTLQVWLTKLFEQMAKQKAAQ